jgi:pimeloyl-ACP methyl ester carboxylesterase
MSRLPIPRLRLSWQPSWHADAADDQHGPRIALMHGLMAGNHMQRHLLQQVRDWGFADSSLFANHARPALIADHLQRAARHGRPIVLIGYSQGGFLAVQVARVLAQRGVAVDLLVTIAAGGLGRMYPAQWGVDPRPMPDNVKQVINAFSAADRLGGDRRWLSNWAVPSHWQTTVENIGLTAEHGIDHLALARCYPADRVHPVVQRQLWDRLRVVLDGLGRGLHKD